MVSVVGTVTLPSRAPIGQCKHARPSGESRPLASARLGVVPVTGALQHEEVPMLETHMAGAGGG